MEIEIKKDICNICMTELPCMVVYCEYDEMCMCLDCINNKFVAFEACKSEVLKCKK